MFVHSLFAQGEYRMAGRPHGKASAVRANLSLARAVRTLALVALIAAAAPGRADVILKWNTLLVDAIRADNTAANVATRNFAILHSAIWDAVNSVSKTHQPYAFLHETPTDTSAEAAAVGAGYHIFVALYPSFVAWADDFYDAWLTSAQSGPALDNGLKLGAQVAGMVLESRRNDGSTTDVPYIPSSKPGEWQRTPPFFRPPSAPQWGYVDPFCLPALEPFLPESPPALDSPEYAAALNEVKALGSRDSAVRTPEQSQIATFWSDFNYSVSPPGHWHQMAASIARARNNSLLENARLFALLSLAQADAAIVCWRAKYRHNVWRPVTAVQRAAEDGNDATQAVSDWSAFLATPSFPAYTSGHSTFSKASAEVLARFYNTDQITFSATSDSLPGIVRTFNNLSACVDEIGRSRIYGGIHYEFDNREGKRTGQAVAQYITANYLLPNDQLPELRLHRFVDGIPQLLLHGRVGVSYLLQVSSGPADWKTLSTNVAAIGGIVVIGSDAASDPSRFYRVLEAVPLPDRHRHNKESRKGATPEISRFAPKK